MAFAQDTVAVYVSVGEESTRVPAYGLRVLSPSTATAQASRLLTEPNVHEAVADAVARRAERTQITRDWVV